MSKLLDYVSNQEQAYQDNPVKVEDTGIFATGDPVDDNLLVSDGDTLAGSSGQLYRLEGAHAPEIAQILTPEEHAQIFGIDVPFTGGRRVTEIKPGEAGGIETTQAVKEFLAAAKANGNAFDRVIKTGASSHGREVVRMTNAQGQDLVEELYRQGIYKPRVGTEQKYVEMYEAGERARALGEQDYNEVQLSLDEAIANNQLTDPATGLPIYANTAVNEAEYATRNTQAGVYNLYGDVAFRDPNRTLDNMAKNSIGASAYTGWLGMQDGFFGAMQMLGDRTGWEGLENYGSDNLEAQARLMSDLPDINNYDWNDVNGIMDGIQFLGNQFASSAPYLALTFAGGVGAGALGLAGVVGVGAAALPSAVVYSGQVWNEMEGEKSAGAAMAGGAAAALVDRLGLQGIIKPSQMFTKEGVEFAAGKLVETGRAASIEAARKMVNNNARQVAADVFTTAGKAASQQAQQYLKRQNLVQETLRGAARGGIGEAATEAIQETIQYTAAATASDKQFNQWELTDRVEDAILAGGFLGAGLGGASGVGDFRVNQATRADFAAAESKRNNAIEQIYHDLRNQGEDIPTVQEILTNLHDEVPAWYDKQEAAYQRNLEKKGTRKKKEETDARLFSRLANKWDTNARGFVNTMQNIESIPDGIAKALTGVGKLVSAAGTTAYSPENLAKSAVLREIRALVGQTRGVINPGLSFEGAHDFTHSKLAQQIYMPDVLRRFNYLTDRDANRKQISSDLREFAQGGWYDAMKNNNEIGDMPAHLRKHAQALYQTAVELETLGNNIREEQNSAIREDGGEEIAYLEGWWWKHRDFDPAKVQADKEGWLKFMREHASELTESELQEFYDKITSGEASSVEDAFTHVGGLEFKPGHHKKRSADLSEKEGFDQFGRDDMFATFDASTKSAARYSTYRRYFGSGGKNLDFLFKKLQDEGALSPKQIEEIAWYTKAIIDSHSGNFNRIQNAKWAALQKFASTWSIFAGLPLAFFSSIPETAMTAMGLQSPEVAGAISKGGKEIADFMGNMMDKNFVQLIKNGDVVPVDESGKPISINKETHGEALLNQAGLYWVPVSAAKRLGVGETNINYSWLQDRFFQYTGITGITQVQRRMAAAISVDFVSNRLANLAQADMNNLTNKQQVELNQLTELGINVPQMVELWKDFGNNEKFLDYTGAKREIPKDVMDIVDQNMQTAVYNFVNMRIQNPGAANRPLFFQDPHYQMLTQFNGFLSTYTANVVPKLWNDYIRRGTPQIKYQTFQLMLVMMAMGAASQYMKDKIKYGRSTPYLSDPKLLQRAIYSSGVLGQAERVVDIAFPLYGGSPRYRSMFDTILDIAVGEAGPTVRNIGTIGTGLEALTEGEFGKASEQAWKVAPIISPLASVRKGLRGVLEGDPFSLDYYDDL